MSDSEIEHLSAAAEKLGMSMSAFVRFAVKREADRYRERELEEAAEALLSAYSSGSELIDFTRLDGADFE